MTAPPIITLTTDFGLTDGYVGAVKGVILRINPAAGIVDISHHIPSQDVFRAAFVLRTAAPYFPDNTIHLAVVDPGVGSSRRAILLKTENQLYLSPDNGTLTHILRRPGSKTLHQIENQSYFRPRVSHTFHGRDIFAPVAANLSLGVPPEDMGPEIYDPVLLNIPDVTRNDIQLTGRVIYVDRFGNLVTNLALEEVASFAGGREIRTTLDGGLGLTGVKSSYTEVAPGEYLAIFGSWELLEISKNLGNAAAALGISPGVGVTITRLKQ
ncbi:MAG: SAM-dependent chlorinase/fluorinase [Deltaproteobacteria bacterium]|nr:SAM-dependent chlorinase/fluorinase [Deltaproteobacteria bacterium]